MIDIKTLHYGRVLLKKEAVVAISETDVGDGKLETNIYLSSGVKLTIGGGLDELIEYIGDDITTSQKSDEPKHALFESISQKDADMLFSIVNKSIETSIRAMRSEFFQVLRDAR
ncbi:hypothetical protein AB7W56_15115 [Providencia rettgeri]|uniref:hypothetical protein n=1 Tax=Providencia manganoxydans TaxID=2923283 RepID=UPI0034E44093